MSAALLALLVQATLILGLIALNRPVDEMPRQRLEPVLRWSDVETPEPPPPELPVEPPPPSEEERVEESAPPLSLSAPELAPIDLPPLPATAVDVRIPEVVLRDELPRRPVPIRPPTGPLAADRIERAPRGVPGNREPEYPFLARRRGWGGTVTVEIVIDDRGSIVSANVVSVTGRDVFREAALEAVRTWRFEPGFDDGRPVACRLTQRITFDPKRR